MTVDALLEPPCRLTRRLHLLRRSATLGPVVIFGVWLLISIRQSQPLHPLGRLNYFDLGVYRGGAHLILSGSSLYATKVTGMYFTYTPAAAIMFIPMTLFSVGLDGVVLTALSLVALVGSLWFALQLTSPRSESLSSRVALVILVAAGALWLEPVTTTLAYGQINLIIVLLVLVDLSRADSSRTKGALIGLAAGLKLTPLIFVAYLLLSGRRRVGAIALGVFAATVVLGFAVLPADSHRYWSGVFVDTDRIGGVLHAGAGPANQSLRGALMRIDPSLGLSAWWIVIDALVCVAGVGLAVLRNRRGDAALGFAICAVTGLLMSPVSWSHHWVIGVPALFVVGIEAYRRGSKLGLAATVGAGLIGYSYAVTLAQQHDPRGIHLRPDAWFTADPYVLIGLSALVLAAVTELRRFSRGSQNFEVTAVASVPPLRVGA